MKIKKKENVSVCKCAGQCVLAAMTTEVIQVNLGIVPIVYNKNFCVGATTLFPWERTDSIVLILFYKIFGPL